VKLRSTLLAATLLACAAAGCGPEPRQGPAPRTADAFASTPPKPGGSAPDFSLRSTEGKPIHLSDYLGKSVVLIDFWSTACDPCLAEMPYLVDLYKAKKDQGFVILAVSLDGPESLADVNRVAHDKELVFPVLLDEETTVVSRYNPKREMPFSVLIDKSGTIVQKKAGYTPGDEKVLASEVEKALRGGNMP
jgi:peroxiredoxin